jgi:hypothetical protein
MGGHPARTYWEDRGLQLLMAGLLLPPAAWFLDLQVSYPLVKWVCGTGHRGVLLAVSAGSLAIIGLAAAMSWSCLKRLRTEPVDPDGARMEDRSYLLAASGLALSATFALLVLVSALPRVVSNPCQ